MTKKQPKYIKTSDAVLALTRVVRYYPELRHLFIKLGANDSLAMNCALLYSHVDYWNDKGSILEDGFIYKYVDDIERETGLKKNTQWRCRTFLRSKGWLEEKPVVVNKQKIVAFKLKYRTTLGIYKQSDTK